MAFERPPRRSRLDPTVGLVDIVFLLVMFFLLAGTVARPLGTDITLIKDGGKDAVPPPDALVMTATGDLQFRGLATDPTAFMASLPPDAKGTVRIVPDAAAPADQLIRIARELTTAGATDVIIVTQRASDDQQ